MSVSRFFKKVVPKTVKDVPVFWEGKETTLRVRWDSRARHLKLRCVGGRPHLRLTSPPHVTFEDALIFFEKHRVWAFEALNGVSVPRLLSLGDSISLLGESLTIGPGETRSVRRLGNMLEVKAACTHEVDMRVRRWLKLQALAFFTAQSEKFAVALGVNKPAVRIRDMKSRWGSCSNRGHLTYNWRVIMAPQEVASYLCAHEVAHLLHMNHSAAFWGVVESLCPGYVLHRNWLKTEGKTLFF